MNESIFTDANFEADVLKADLPVLVDFFATWCGPCRMQGPIVEEVAKEIGAKAKVGKMDVDANPQTAEKFEVMSIPTIIIFRKGQEVQRLVGLQNKDSLLAELNKLV
ncbi:MAG: thioredoxin [Patescibacteria group bacterium]